MSLGISVSQVGEDISLHSDICSMGKRTHISRNCSWLGKTHSTRAMCQEKFIYYGGTDVTVT